jgi:hypothetical protein
MRFEWAEDMRPLYAALDLLSPILKLPAALLREEESWG